LNQKALTEVQVPFGSGELLVKWSKQTEEALRLWLSPDTWEKSHSKEDARFSVFIASVWNDEHSIWDEAEVREKIRNKAVELHPGYEELAEEVAINRVSEGTAILNFLSHVREKDKFALLSS
jgi:hypothetical protein